MQHAVIKNYAMRGRMRTLEEAGFWGFGSLGWLVLNVLSSDAKCLDFCIKVGLIQEFISCTKEDCDGIMTHAKDPSERLGYRFKCYECSNKKSLLYDSWFSGMHAEIRTIILFVYLWVHQCNQSEIMCQTGISSPIRSQIGQILS